MKTRCFFLLYLIQLTINVATYKRIILFFTLWTDSQLFVFVNFYFVKKTEWKIKKKNNNKLYLKIFFHLFSFLKIFAKMWILVIEHIWFLSKIKQFPKKMLNSFFFFNSRFVSVTVSRWKVKQFKNILKIVNCDLSSKYWNYFQEKQILLLFVY